MNNITNKLDITELHVKKKDKVRMVKALAILASALTLMLTTYTSVHFGLTAHSNYLEGYENGRVSMLEEVSDQIGYATEIVKSASQQLELIQLPTEREWQEEDYEIVDSEDRWN